MIATRDDMLYTDPMSKTLRIVLLCLLALAIPLQGFAAASRVLCAATSPHRCHEAGKRMAHGMQAAAPVHGHASHGHDASVHDRAGQCGTCAACCMAIALPVTLPSIGAIQFKTGLVAFEPQAKVAFVTEGLERPPRPMLA